MKINEIDWRPIGECKQGEALPENCFAVYRSKTGDITSSDLEFDVTSFDVSFAIIRKPVPERVLKACPFPACGRADRLRVQKDDRNDCFVECENCHCRGPSCIIPSRAKEAWGYE